MSADEPVTTAPPGGEPAIPWWRLEPSRARRVRAIAARSTTLLATLGAGEPPGDAPLRDLLDRVGDELDVTEPAAVWLAHAVLAARMPGAPTVAQSVRRGVLDGPAPVVRLAFDRAGDPGLDLPADADILRDLPDTEGWPAVEVVSDTVVLDVSFLDAAGAAAGRTARAAELVRRWIAAHDPVVVRWTNHGTTLRRIDDRSLADLLAARPRAGRPPSGRADRAVVPWRCTYVLPALPTDVNQVRSLVGLLRWSGNTGAAVGHGFVSTAHPPILAGGPPDPDHRTPDAGDALARGLSVARHLDRLATDSPAAALEYEGWKRMLRASGTDGPDVVVVDRADDTSGAADSWWGHLTGAAP